MRAFLPVLTAGLLTASVALADPVLQAGGKPGVAASFSQDGAAVTLVIAAGFDPAAVAEAISAGVPGAQAKVVGQKVVVSGVAQATLLTALEKVDVAPAGDDVDAMLSALQNPGGEDDGSGSSIRATNNNSELEAVRGPPGELVFGKVVKVRRARFPLVFITVQVERGPKVGAPAKGETIVVLPRVKSKHGVVDPDDAASQLNVGAWYAQPGDKVKVRLEAKKEKKVWVAKAFERATPGVK